MLRRTQIIQRLAQRFTATSTVAAGVVFVLTVMLDSCSGCSRDSISAPTAGTAPATEMRDDPADILTHPVQFDAQAITECAHLAMADRTLTSAEAARCIVNAEAAANHLGQLLDELARNEDAADTWNSLTELAALPWPAQTLQILDGLDRQPLDGPERERVDNIRSAMNRNAILATEICTTQHIHNAPAILPCATN